MNQMPQKASYICMDNRLVCIDMQCITVGHRWPLCDIRLCMRCSELST